MNLIYLIPNKGGKVFDSQVEGLLEEISNQKKFENIYLVSGYKSGEDWVGDKNRLEKKGIKLLLFKRYANYGVFSILQKLSLRNCLKKILTENTILHLRGDIFSYYVYQIIKSGQFDNVKIVTDIRGAAVEERLIYNPELKLQNLSRVKRLKKSLKRACEVSDIISCVSESLKKYIIDATGVSADKVFVNHCMAGKNFYYDKAERELTRDKLGVKPHDVLLVFLSQAGSKWQSVDEIQEEIVKRGFRLLLLSDDKSNDPDIINAFVPYAEVPSYLNAADVGFIWRNDDIVNNVASPTKFSEYVCCGLPVISNRGVHLINEYIRRTKYGRTVEKYDEINEELVEELVALDRHAISKNGIKTFAVTAIAEQYIKIYNNLINYGSTF